MGKQDNIAAQKRFGGAINSGDLEAIREVVAPGVVDHDPAANQGPGPQGFIDFFRSFRKAFPDLKVEVEQMVADEDNVALAYTVTGTHRGDFHGVPATGKKMEARGVQIARFENGKMVERWGSSDELGMLKQLGVEPAS
ncbi:hypothetical protein BH23GEM4_BH23GEM4_19420 [soil metagenome]